LLHKRGRNALVVGDREFRGVREQIAALEEGRVYRVYYTQPFPIILSIEEVGS